MTVTLPVLLALLVSIFIVGIVYVYFLKYSKNIDNMVVTDKNFEPFYFVDSGNDY
ncbi:MAG: hypothetical protein WCF93_04340 [Candidatus Moraniibacteriota bacterium]